MRCGVLKLMHQSDAHYSTSYNQGIMMAPITQSICRMYPKVVSKTAHRFSCLVLKCEGKFQTHKCNEYLHCLLNKSLCRFSIHLDCLLRTLMDMTNVTLAISSEQVVYIQHNCFSHDVAKR